MEGESSIEDSSDRIYSIDGVKIYAITREKFCKSTLLVKIINKCGEAEGFDRILQRISDSTNPASLQMVSLMVSMIGKMNCLLHWEFAQQYVPNLWKAVSEYLRNNPNINIDKYPRKTINDIPEALDELLKRVYSLPEKNEIVEMINVSLYSSCFNINSTTRELTVIDFEDFKNNLNDSAIGPLGKENFEIEKWKAIMTHISELNTSDTQVAIPSLKQILTLLIEFNSYSNYNDYFVDISIKEYFFTNFLPQIATYLLEADYVNKPEVLKLSNSCLEQMILFWAKTIPEDHPKLTEMARTIFDLNTNYHKVNNQEEIVRGVIPSFNSKVSQEHLDWIRSIKIGDMIDCVKLDSRRKLMCWSHAEVVDIFPNMLKISYVGDNNEKFLAKLANANEMAPYNTKCTDFDWRFNLRKGDKVDANDKSCYWLHSTVLDIRETQVGKERTLKEAFIGFRVFEGDDVDKGSNTKNFAGWGPGSDEWINVTDPRLSQYKSFAKKFFSGVHQRKNIEPVIEDSNDRIYSVNGVKIYAITRENICRSVIAIRMINKFGEAGGFDRILERIQNTEKSLPLDLMVLLLKLIGGLSSILHAEFAKEYILPFWKAVLEYLKNCPDNILINKREEINKVLSDLLVRVYSIPEKDEMIAKMDLDICSDWLQSEYPGKKAKGFDLLIELIQMAQLKETKALNIKHLEIDTNIVKWNADFLRLLLDQENRTDSDFKKLWRDNCRRQNLDENLDTGPFTKESFNLEKWKSIVNILRIAKSEEAKVIIAKILKLLQELNTVPDYNNYFGDSEIKDYFFKKFFIKLAENLLRKYKVEEDLEVFKLANCCLEEMVVFWIKAIYEDHPKLTEMARIVLDINMKHYNVDYQQDTQEVIVSFDNEAKQQGHLGWINSLRKGDLIDCLKTENICGRMCWSHANVVDVLPNQINISYIGETNELDKVLNKVTNANEIAPYKTKCKDFIWRNNLKIGSVLDAYSHNRSIWYGGTVMDVRETKVEEEMTIKEVLIAFRVYDKKGDKSDEQGKSYFGFGKSFDEWINITNPRLSKKNTIIKQFIINSKCLRHEQDNQDSNDRLYPIDGTKTYAIARSRDGKYNTIVRIINKFGKLRGFDKLLERIGDLNKPIPIEIMVQILTIIANISRVLHREFVQEYVPKLKKVVWRSLLESSDDNLKNLTPIRIDKISAALSKILQMIYSVSKAEEMVCKLKAALCSVCFDSKLVEVQCLGLQLVLNVMKILEDNDFTTLDNLPVILSQKKLFNGDQGYIKLIRRSSGLFPQEGNLNSLNLRDIWNVVKTGNHEERISIYQVLLAIAHLLCDRDVEFITNHICGVYSRMLVKEEIKLLQAFKNYPNSSLCKVNNFFWDILIYLSDQISSELAEFTLDNLYNLVKNQYKNRNFGTHPNEFFTYSLEKGYDAIRSYRNKMKANIEAVKGIKEGELNDSFLNDKKLYLCLVKKCFQVISLIFQNCEVEPEVKKEAFNEFCVLALNESLFDEEKANFCKSIQKRYSRL